jgi:hypothetical protein
MKAAEILKKLTDYLQQLPEDADIEKITVENGELTVRYTLPELFFEEATL